MGLYKPLPMYYVKPKPTRRARLIKYFRELLTRIRTKV